MAKIGKKSGPSIQDLEALLLDKEEALGRRLALLRELRRADDQASADVSLHQALRPALEALKQSLQVTALGFVDLMAGIDAAMDDAED